MPCSSSVCPRLRQAVGFGLLSYVIAVLADKTGFACALWSVIILSSKSLLNLPVISRYRNPLSYGNSRYFLCVLEMLSAAAWPKLSASETRTCLSSRYQGRLSCAVEMSGLIGVTKAAGTVKVLPDSSQYVLQSFACVGLSSIVAGRTPRSWYDTQDQGRYDCSATTLSYLVLK